MRLWLRGFFPITLRIGLLVILYRYSYVCSSVNQSRLTDVVDAVTQAASRLHLVNARETPFTLSTERCFLPYGYRTVDF